MKRTSSIVLLPIALFMSGSATASLIGDEVGAVLDLDGGNFNRLNSTFPATPALINVSATSSEYSWDFSTVARYGADIQSSSFELTYEVLAAPGTQWGHAPLNWMFSSLNWVGVPNSKITNVTMTSSDWITCTGNMVDCTPGNMAPVAIDIVNFGDDSVHIRIDSVRMHSISNSPFFTDLGISAGQTFTASFALATDHGSVPEPTTLALMGLGLAGLGYRRKKVKLV